jgi:hypothetical protein
MTLAVMKVTGKSLMQAYCRHLTEPPALNFWTKIPEKG